MNSKQAGSGSAGLIGTAGFHAPRIPTSKATNQSSYFGETDMWSTCQIADWVHGTIWRDLESV